MEYLYRRKLFFLVAFIFLSFAVLAQEYTEDPLESVTDTSWGNRSKELSHTIDSQNCGKGCGAILSHNAQFIMNPSLTLMQKLFTFSTSYQYLKSASVSVSDSRTSKIGGGVLYARHSGLNMIKTNFAFPIYQWIFGGINLNNYIGDFSPIQKKGIKSHSFDVGISAVISDFLYLGFGATDVWTFSGKAIPRKISFQFEFDINDMFYFNNAWQYHLESEKEKFPDKRSKLKDFDFYTGFEFRYSWFRAGLGFNNLSYTKDLTWGTTLKTFSLAFYQPSGGGIYGNFMFNDNYMTFSINLVWEPPLY